MIEKEMKMVSVANLSGGAFELKTGRPWTHGLNYRDREPMNVHWEKTGPVTGRWFFEINGMQFSAKSISPRIEGIQQHF